MQNNKHTNWILNDTIGIFLGIAVAAGILTIEAQLIGQPQTSTEKLGNLGVALIGGLIAGSIMAGFQWRSLRHRYEGLSWTHWWGNTVLAFIAAWVLAIIPSLGYTGENAIQEVIAPFGIPTYTILYGSIIFGGLMGAFIGIAQWMVLKKYRKKRAAQWIGFNVFGWALGFFIIVLAGMIFRSSNPVNNFLLTGVAGGLIAAVCIAAITNYYFRRVKSA